MTTQMNREVSVWIRKTRALAAGLLAAGMMAAFSLMPTLPAQAATTFTVNSTADTPDASLAGAACDTDLFTNGDQCTLRAAIQQANATAGADTITFAIPGTGVKTINVGATGLGRLPTITDPASINGYTQPGASPNTKVVGNDASLKIELSGNGPGGPALEITHVSGSSVVKGLVINRFAAGIDVHGDTVGNRIEGNFIGTDPTGTIAKGNTDDGVNIFDGASENVVGGTTPAARNVISGNACNAVFVKEATGNLVQGNYVGTDKTGTKGLANGDGSDCVAVVIDNSSGNTVGGATAGARNLISGNALDGVGVLGDSQNNKVLGNRIGTTASGTGALGNGEAGVLISGTNAANNLVGDGTAGGSNTIAFNGEDGVEVQGGTGNELSRNSIFSNAGIGIDLSGGFEDAAGNTANDPGDLDSGANGLQNKPVVTSAKNSSTKTTITGTLNGGREVTYLIRFFSNPAGTDEGKKFIGQKSVTTDSSSGATFTFSPANKVAAGQNITATVTASEGTSEFSAPKKVAS